MLGLYSLIASAANLTVVDAASGEEVTITIPGEVDVTVSSDDISGVAAIAARPSSSHCISESKLI